MKFNNLYTKNKKKERKMENIIVYIYNKELELIGQPYVTTYEEFIENPQAFYPDWDEENMYGSKDKLQYPIIEDNSLREKTQEELKLEGIIELEDGEYTQDGKLIVVKYDEKLGYYKKAWDKVEHIWYEGTTHDEFVKMRADKILEYSQLEENKKALENSKFSTQEEIQLIVEKMQILEKEINDIADKVKTL